MKCEKAQTSMLLEQSGELSWYRHLLLKEHLTHCPGCREYREEIGQITTITSDTVLQKDVSNDTIERILAEAKRESSRSEEIRFRPSREPFTVRWRPAIIYSAISVMLLAAFLVVMAPLMKQGPDVADIGTPSFVGEALAWDDGFDEQIASVDELLQIASVADWNGNGTSDASTDTYDANTLATELLELEEQI